MPLSSWSTNPASNITEGGVSIDEGMDPGDVNNAARAIMADMATAIGSANLGALPAGTTIRRSSQMSFTADSGGTTDARNAVEHLSLTGAYAPLTTYNFDYQNDLTHTAGTVNIARGVSSWIRLGYGSTTGGGSLNFGFVFAGHVSNEYTGTFDQASVYYVEPVDLADGTGPINYLRGFYCRDQGHATRIISEGIAFDAEDFTVSTRVSKPTMAHFRSKMTPGTARYSFIGTGGAQFANVGAGRFGDINATDPNSAVEGRGVARFATDGATTSNLNHEFISDQNTVAMEIVNKHASAPNGLRVKFTAAVTDTSHYYFRGESNSVGQIAIWSNGNVVNTNNSYGAISDARFKMGIADAPSVLDRFRQRRFVNYRLIDGDGTLLRGVIAQEEQAIAPELVTEQDDHLTYNYAGLALEAAQAVKELLAIVDAQAAEIAALKAGQ